jgi:hypothetical protein
MVLLDVAVATAVPVKVVETVPAVKGATPVAAEMAQVSSERQMSSAEFYTTAREPMADTVVIGVFMLQQLYPDITAVLPTMVVQEPSR